MGLLQLAHTADPDCACCQPGQKRLVTQTTAMTADAKYAFLLCVRKRKDKFPREVLQNIFRAAELVERRVVTVPAESQYFMPANARRRHAKIGGGGDAVNLEFAGLCMDDDDLPT